MDGERTGKVSRTELVASREPRGIDTLTMALDPEGSGIVPERINQAKQARS